MASAAPSARSGQPSGQPSGAASAQPLPSKPPPRRPEPRGRTIEREARAANRLTLDATISAREDLRYTPVGIAAISMTLLHASEQAEAGGTRRVECELAAVAFAKVAESLAGLPVGTALRFEGFLARRYRTGVTLALHIDRYAQPSTQPSRQPSESSERKQMEGN